MGKIPRTTIVVKDVKANVEYSMVSEQAPRKTEPGPYLYFKVNPKGIAELQQQGKIEQTVNQKVWDAWIIQQLGISADGIGALGKINPATSEGSDEWLVKMGDDVVFPQGAIPTIPVAEPSVVTPADTTPVIAEPAIKTTFDSVGAIVKIVEYKKQGLAEGQILQGLMKKISQAQAEALIEQALRPKIEAQKKDLF